MGSSKKRVSERKAENTILAAYHNHDEMSVIESAVILMVDDLKMA